MYLGRLLLAREPEHLYKLSSAFTLKLRVNSVQNFSVPDQSACHLESASTWNIHTKLVSRKGADIMSTRKNSYLDHGDSDESDLDNGYDSEVAELSKSARINTTTRAPKRRKVSHSNNDESDLESAEESEAQTADDVEDEDATAKSTLPGAKASIEQPLANDLAANIPSSAYLPAPVKRKSKDKQKEKKPGVVYLSSLPPYLKPSALKNLVEQRGFGPIERLFLTPASKAKSTSKKNSRQLYTEGWVEFKSKKTARLCAEALNATPVGGKKGGFYYDDLWNMKYLRGMGWSELMSGVREEKREDEGRRDEERRTIARETKMFIEGVEEGKRLQGMQKKRKAKGRTDREDIKRTWRQSEVEGKKLKDDRVDANVQQVLGKIF